MSRNPVLCQEFGELHSQVSLASEIQDQQICLVGFQHLELFGADVGNCQSKLQNNVSQSGSPNGRFNRRIL